MSSMISSKASVGTAISSEVFLRTITSIDCSLDPDSFSISEERKDKNNQGKQSKQIEEITELTNRLTELNSS